MSNLTTLSDVRRAFDQLRQAVKAAGITVDYREDDGSVTALDADTLQLQAGSPTYGRAFRVHFRHPRTGGLTAGDFTDLSGYVGQTRAEAAAVLDATARGIRAGHQAARGDIIRSTGREV